MKITSISIRNVPPIRLFSVENLSDVVVLAGPNGAGKTRLIQHLLSRLIQSIPDGNTRVVVSATCEDERAEWGGRDSLDNSKPDEAQLLVKLLQRKQSRGNWRSSLLNFESDRTIQPYKPYQFSFDFPDPYSEAVGWNAGHVPLQNRYVDTMHAIFRKIEHQKRSFAEEAIRRKRAGEGAIALDFPDVMEPFEKIFSLLLGPKELAEPDSRQQRLLYTIDGKTYPFTALSSGEREVVQIAFDFQLRNPENCIVVFDEPELHLHPELSYRLIRALRKIGKNNQFVLCTHAPDIISSELENTVIFLAPPSGDDGEKSQNQAISVRDDDATNQALNLLGHSIGIISLGKRIVLIEGNSASLDKKTYGSIIQDRFPSLVLVPSEGKGLVRSFETVRANILSKTIWGVEFFMLCDRDGMLTGSAPPRGGVASRYRVLDRYHLENYFLDEKVWAKAFGNIEGEESWLRDAAQIRKKLESIAENYVAYATALYVAAETRRAVGNADLMPSGCSTVDFAGLEELLRNKQREESERISTVLSPERVIEAARAHHHAIDASLRAGSDEWKALIPGRPILHTFARAAREDLGRAKAMYINASESCACNPFAEIVEIFEDFAANSQASKSSPI